MPRTLMNRGWQYRTKFNPFAEMGRVTIPWHDVTLPHDATIGLARDPGLRRGAWTAYFPGGVYEYRRTVDLPEGIEDKTVLFEFEGVYRGAIVRVNGDLAGHRPSGYARFTVDATSLIRAGANEIQVEARTHEDSRWYAGAGIHRDVWMHVLEPVHLDVDGVRVRTPDVDASLAVTEIETVVVNTTRATRTVVVRSHVLAEDGSTVATSSAPVTVLAGESAVSRLRHYIADPHLWNVDSPHLYTSRVEILDDATLLDARSTSFGIRRLQLDPVSGLRINGAPVKLRGACLHHDNGVIGTATIARAEERRIEILKQAGFNAIRSSHNPVSRAMLDACDRLGMLVVDEAFDMWTVGKTEYGPYLDFPEWWERDLESMVAKDFNHPSVILYSIGNEIPETGTPMGGVWGRRLAEKVRQLDDTRYVTNSINGMLAIMPDIIEMMAAATGSAPGAATQPASDDSDDSDGPGINTMMTDVGDMMNMIGSSDNVTQKTEESFAVVDVAGMNYLESRYETDRDLFPNRIIIGTETFPTRIAKNWDLVLRNSHVLGDFTWTGWDYLGEVGIGRVRYPDDERPGEALSGDYPWLVSWSGDIDITGYRRPASYYREIVFGLRREPYIAVKRPSRFGQRVEEGPWAWSDAVSTWSWGSAGQPVEVEVYSDADAVELLINGRSVGVHPVGAEHGYRTSFTTEFEPGEVAAVAHRDGVACESTMLVSARGDVRLQMAPDRTDILNSDSELVYLDISIVDAAGVTFMDDREVTVSVEGTGTLVGMGGANPATEEQFTASTHRAFDGRILAVVRPHAEGEIRVRATAPGCDSVEVVLDVAAVA